MLKTTLGIGAGRYQARQHSQVLRRGRWHFRPTLQVPVRYVAWAKMTDLQLFGTTFVVAV
jgi:hypothetical protein